jgi:hypothetical protein
VARSGHDRRAGRLGIPEALRRQVHAVLSDQQPCQYSWQRRRRMLATNRVCRRPKPTIRLRVRCLLALMNVMASFDANLLAPTLSQDRVMPNTSEFTYPLTASDDPESTSLLKRQTRLVLCNGRALQCPDAIRLR